jgi:arylformamidase
MNTSIQDVSAVLGPGTPVWPGDPALTIEVQSHLDRGDSATVHRVLCSTHTGTHVDAPAHFIRGGGSLGTVPWDGLVGPATMVDTGDEPLVTGDVLERLCPRLDTPILLLRTRNSRDNLWGAKEFRRDFTALDPSAATWLVSRDVKGVGIDFLSIEPFGSGAQGHPVHLALLAKRVAVVEGLDLRRATPGRGRFVCLPLRLESLEGAPARAIWMPDPD